MTLRRTALFLKRYRATHTVCLSSTSRAVYMFRYYTQAFLQTNPPPSPSR